MDKYKVRRIGAIISILSFFFTWYKNFDSDGTSYSGLKMITQGFSDGGAGNFVGTIVLITAAIQILILVYPKVPSLILSILAGIFWSVMFFGSSAMANFRGTGSYIFIAGMVIVVLSIFFKKAPLTQEDKIQKKIAS